MEDTGASKLLLSPVDRAAEILYGLIMALTFTCSISIANARHSEIRQLLFAAIACNFAWGLVDAAMYLIGVMVQRNRKKVLLGSVQRSSTTAEAAKYISDALSPELAAVISTEEFEKIRNQLIKVPVTAIDTRLTRHDIKKAIALFLVMFVSTFPVVAPFAFIRDTNIALRVSNMVAIVMMFLCGWSVSKYVGLSKWKMSIAMTLVGIVLVIATIALGG